ncbi:bifunctional diguanylate cyclase/phosphodiesterase [Congregibacter brevis]|uniref:Bifunctional diguanylate cyclase/phosphodiesterase n=1 Tax=Congregibacter brevis TaxID=3081201 RepID=A0ABZ0IG78_9GAMM|nr:bifunctional diguanylate cyclase/phosphodiesterase [Congregibacter sp. IMCC45268]
MFPNATADKDSLQGLHDRLRVSAFSIGVMGFVVNAIAYLSIVLLGDVTALITLEVGSYAVVLGLIAFCAYRDVYVQRVLFGGLVAIYITFWLTAFAYAYRQETMLLSLPLVVFVPLLVTMVLPHKLLLGLIPFQFFAMHVYVSEFGLADMGVTWSDPQQFAFSLGLAGFSSVCFLAFAVLAIARTDTDVKLVDLMGDKEHMASVDSLTELLNRRAFLNRLEDHWPPSQGFAIAFLDLDHFKPLNDQYGHQMGDYVLGEVANRLREVPSTLATARLGGDEFAVCCIDPGRQKPAEEAAAELHSRLVVDLQTDIGPISMGVSLGFAVYDESYESLSMLLRAADAAMRRAKSTKSGWATFDHEIDSAALATSSIEFELKAALRSGNIRAAVQPIALTSDMNVTEYELLARWVNSGLEQDPGPAQFIPIAEKQGLLNEMLWVTLSEALDELNFERHRLAINVSPAQLSASDFVDKLLEVLEAHAVSPGSITLEVTEEVVFRNLDRNVEVLNRAREAGMAIALDDFGSGYSSLSMLGALPLDKLKIDQTLIRKAQEDRRSANILNAAITLAQQLELIACVEGVETQEALDQVVAMGADQVQGYFIGRPSLIQTLTGSDV